MNSLSDVYVSLTEKINIDIKEKNLVAISVCGKIKINDRNKLSARLLNPVSPRGERVTIFFLHGTTENFYFYSFNVICKRIAIIYFIETVITFSYIERLFRIILFKHFHT